MMELKDRIKAFRKAKRAHNRAWGRSSDDQRLKETFLSGFYASISVTDPELYEMVIETIGRSEDAD